MEGEGGVFQGRYYVHLAVDNTFKFVTLITEHNRAKTFGVWFIFIGLGGILVNMADFQFHRLLVKSWDVVVIGLTKTLLKFQ